MNGITMNHNELVLSNARIVLAHEVVHGSVQLRDGRIAGIDAGATAVPGAIDLEGDHLLPGLVEVHTDNLERHVMPRPRVFFPAQSAVQSHDAEIAAAGITTVFDAIGVGDPYDDGFRAKDQSSILQVIDLLEDAGVLRTRHYVHIRCELPAPNARELFEPFARHPRLKLLSLMDHTPGQRQWNDIEHARIYYTGKKGWSLQKFEEELRLAPRRQADHAEPNRRWFVEFAHEQGVALATHDDTTLAHVDEAVALGAAMSEFPTTMAAAQHAKAVGLATIAGAPNVVRGGSHSGNVAALDLARAGVLDVLSSDYVPASLIHAAWCLHQQGGFTLSEAVNVVSRNPAQATGLHDRGEIAPGRLGDVIRVREVNARPVVCCVWRGGQRVC
ncbi:alpha-D-ribose 1-methylphosphonate 5-triphosphate diphosphatase [Schlegelella sp. S2-27]|uniref:Alpha-D-ribose 1-methylphosphonate 5-triphosphate diphosphatase n=1 Tax=Caldimonas mangrovi TaxID=2944811 RepID=A0ABT0YYG7_9BURK|nr:alpha-D-ribose 1-methylphosphonate 5-triphosphate diphosphatase [Caldimonas mangrovi]MCM5682878.1 alpha-D-ribose 1-methylphosphonate 5-triphosphate diphosphatase [Caldimonas mangrovi]